jgi:hypothetical protein
MIVVVIVVAILYMRRDSIARDIANSVLADSDLIVTDLSVDSLSPEAGVRDISCSDSPCRWARPARGLTGLPPSSLS